jgi:hypothetical protein
LNNAPDAAFVIGNVHDRLRLAALDFGATHQFQQFYDFELHAIP